MHSHLMHTVKLLHLFMPRCQMRPLLSVSLHSASSTTFSSGVNFDLTKSIRCREDRLERMEHLRSVVWCRFCLMSHGHLLRTNGNVLFCMSSHKPMHAIERS